MKKTINITLKMAEIIYDIQNKTYLTGRSLNDGENHGHVANMQANDDEENAAQILRSVTSSYAVLRNRLAEFMDISEASVANDMISGDEDIVVSLQMPSNFNTVVAQSIAEAAHQFIVAGAIADWFSITAKGETSDYSKAAEAAMKLLEESLARRLRPQRQS